MDEVRDTRLNILRAVLVCFINGVLSSGEVYVRYYVRGIWMIVGIIAYDAYRRKHCAANR